MLKNKICLITGGTSGLGMILAQELAAKQAQVILVGRDKIKCRETVSEIRQETANNNVDYLLADLSNLHETRELAKKFLLKYDKLHILINNAGVFYKNNVCSKNCFQITMTVNYLSPFLLSNLLLKNLTRAKHARIINIASLAHRKASLDLDNFMGRGICAPKEAYGRSKLALIMFTYELARRLKKSPVTANVMCPGGVATGIWKNNQDLRTQAFRLLMPLLKTPQQAAKLVMYLAESPELEKTSGKYFEISSHLKFIPFNVTKTQCKSSKISYDSNLAKKLWQISEKLTNL